MHHIAPIYLFQGSSQLPRRTKKTQEEYFGPLEKGRLRLLIPLKYAYIRTSTFFVKVKCTLHPRHGCMWQRSKVFSSAELEWQEMARPIGCWSQSFSRQKNNISTIHCECPVVVWAILLLQTYLKSASFTLRTYRHKLRCIQNLADATGGVAHWRLL